jgi:hypothetical protein
MEKGIINSRQIVRELLKDTQSRKVRWKCVKEDESKVIFKYEKKITEKKTLIFILTSRREKHASDLTVLYGPIEKDTKEKKLVCCLTPRNQSLVYDLIDQMNIFWANGDVDFIRESKVNEFHSKGHNYSDIKLISNLSTDTVKGKVEWIVNFHEGNIAVFLAKHQITPLKHMAISLRCDQNSKVREDNILRCILKNDVTQGGTSHSAKVIKSVSLKEVPSLIHLIKLLYRRLLQIEYKSPFIEDKKVGSQLSIDFSGGKETKSLTTQEPRFQPLNKPRPKHTTVVVDENDLEGYRNHVLDSIKLTIRELPNASNWAEKYTGVFDAYDEIRKAKSFEDIDEWLFVAMREAGKR